MALQSVDLTPYFVLFVGPMAILAGIYLLVVFAPLPRRVSRLQDRVAELEARVEDDEDRD